LEILRKRLEKERKDLLKALRSKEDNRKEREKFALKVTTLGEAFEQIKLDEEIWDINIFERPTQGRKNLIPAGAENEFNRIT
jgi:hypothetical protein